MPYVKDVRFYRQIPFSADTPSGEFYKFINVAELSDAENNASNVQQRCRTIGVLQSINGQYILKNIDRHNSNNRCEVHVSFEYTATPPPPALVPYTVQLFGFLGFKDSNPVIYATVIQPLPHNLACRMYRILNGICRTHLATAPMPEDIPVVDS